MAKKTKKKGNVPEGDVRLAVNMDRKLHKRLKLAAVMRDTTIGDLLEDLIKKHLWGHIFALYLYVLTNSCEMVEWQINLVNSI